MNDAEIATVREGWILEDPVSMTPRNYEDRGGTVKWVRNVVFC